MARRSSLPSYLALFAVPFLLSVVAAYGVRTWSNSSTSTPTDTSVETTVAETTVAATTPLIVETSLPAETTVPDTVAETTLPPETTVAPPSLPDAPRTGSGAVLQPLADADRRLYEESAGCDSLARPGTTARACDITTSAGLDVAWVSMEGGLDVLTHDEADGPDVWKVVLRANAAPSRSPLFADVVGDGNDVLVAGWRSNDGTLAIDVVEFDPDRFSSPEVTLHASLPDGRVAIDSGRLDAWAGLGADPSQPTSYVHWTFTGGGPEWKASKERDDSPPAGQL